MIIQQWNLDKTDIGEFFIRFDERAQWRVIIKTPHPGCFHSCDSCDVKVVPIAHQLAVETLTSYGKSIYYPDSEIEF